MLASLSRVLDDAFPGTSRRWTWLALLLVPALVAGLLTWAFWSPSSSHGAAKAAVVNLDEPVTVDGRLVPLGRQLAAELVHGEDKRYEWVLTDDEDAGKGLRDGTYAASVTVPRTFSERATSSATGRPLEATQATLEVETSPEAALADASVSQDVADAAVRTLNTQVVETYLDNVYVGFTTLHEQMGKAADGADRLADGTGDLATGTRRLAGGARQVADGNRRLADTVTPVADRIVTAIDGVPSATDATNDLARLSARCRADAGSRGTDQQFCESLARASGRLSAVAGDIDGMKSRARSAAGEIKQSLNTLASGAEQVADGTAQLATRSKTLASGIASAATGARQLDTGIKAADKGARQLSAGAGQLSRGGTSLAAGATRLNAGAQQVAAGTAQAHKGAGDLASGADRLSGGAAKADDGAITLAKGLTDGLGEVPAYTSTEREHLSKVAATPVLAPASATGDLGPIAGTFFLVLALWAGALATYLVIRAVPASVLTSRLPTWRLAGRALIPGTVVAVVTGALLGLGLAPFLGLDLAGRLAFLAVTLLAALAFTALCQAVAAVLRRSGRLLSVAVLVLTVATGALSSIPAPLAAAEPLLPTHGAIIALRAIATGAGGDLAGGLAHLVVWLLIGLAGTFYATERHRTLSPRDLRLDSPVI
ncbi:YhgE/Pip family protein [Nonomuraea jabiensis]|uniref:YhgE/Pip family protein n=1 Tax=Nonomuraea jabiensis TaxID=882448 RepID=UPI003445E79B